MYKQQLILLGLAASLTACNGSNTASVNDSNGNDYSILKEAKAANPGYKIAYGDERRIWMMDPDGTMVEQLADNGADGVAGYVSWGPNAEFIYFAGHKGVPGIAWEAYRVNIKTKEVTQITNFMHDVRSLSVSTDGEYLAISIMTGNSNVIMDATQFNTDLHIVRMSDAEAIWDAGNMLTKEDMTVLVSSPPEEKFWYEELNWNPVAPEKGELPVLAYTKTWRYNEDDISYTHAFTIKADGSENTPISENSHLPVWDFSGTKLVFADQSFYDFSDNTKKQLHVSGISLEVAGGVASPDGQFIIFEVGDEERQIGMARFSLEKGNPGVIFPSIQGYEPKWSPIPLQ